MWCTGELCSNEVGPKRHVSYVKLHSWCLLFVNKNLTVALLHFKDFLPFTNLLVHRDFGIVPGPSSFEFTYDQGRMSAA
jgi:hypothetical protein